MSSINAPSTVNPSICVPRVLQEMDRQEIVTVKGARTNVLIWTESKGAS